MIPPEVKRLGSHRIVTAFELTERPGPPSRVMREIEASMVAELARLAVMDGFRFEGWPKFEVLPDKERYYGDGWALRAEVAAVPS